MIGEPRTHVAECESTQLLLGPDDPEGAIATTDHQTAGRGRRGRRWTEAAGTAVLVSVLLRPPPERSAPELSLVAAAAVALALEDVTGRAAQVKWPNDVLFDGRKAAGILAEAKGAAVVLGIGVNVNGAPGEQVEAAKLVPVSLRALDGVERDREAVLEAVLRRLDGCYAAWRERGLAAVHGDLAARDFLRGRRVRAGAVSGVAGGIDGAGRLLVADGGGGGTVAVESGEITLLDPSG